MRIPLILITDAMRDASVPLWQAVNMMTRNPAKALGEPNLGVLVPGNIADLVCFGEHVQIIRVYRAGIAPAP